MVGGAHAAGIPALVRRRPPGAAAVCAARDPRRRPLDDEPAHRQRLVSDVRRRFLAGGLCSLFRVLRPARLADRSVPNLRPERAGRLRDPPDGGRAPSSPTCRTTARSGTSRWASASISRSASRSTGTSRDTSCSSGFERPAQLCSSLPLGVTFWKFGSMLASTRPDDHARAPSKSAWYIGFDQTSSRWPIEV